LEGFKELRDAMRAHLDETQPTLTATIVEPYDHRIRELQAEICDYLLRQRESLSPCAPDDSPTPVGSGSATAKP
jgi:hypothetical protein